MTTPGPTTTSTTAPGASAPASPGASGVLERNLLALSRTCPRIAERLRTTPPRTDIEFIETPDGVPSATLTLAGASRSLASRRAPLDEARRLVGDFDPVQKALVVVTGFGLGYHVAEAATRLGRTGIVIVFEPDLALLRSVLERVNCATWLEASNVTIMTDPTDQAAISAAIEGNEGIATIGVEVIDHPPSRVRLGEDAPAFRAAVQDVLKAVRTIVVTTMVQARATLRNLTANVDHYARRPGVADLAGCAAGRAAIVVSAGPSLHRTIDALADPALRDRVVIIAAQTVLRPLLDRGIRPHFVTALDYHEISRRFYESLTPEDVEGVTLVVEPKVNPAVLDAYPGVVRCARSVYLDELLGEGLGHAGDGPGNAIRPGATVAHLSYYLARHLGCDPVILTGQDLGFTDHQYYAAGASIHDVWACELSDFMTLEMFEWQRIKRMGAHLRRRTDVNGRTIYTDEQMSTYLVQFERDFAADAERGLTTIDATEGGVAKRAAIPMTIREAIERHAAPDAPPLSLPQPTRAPVGARRIAERLRSIRADVHTIGENSRRAGLVLTEMLEHQKDQARVNRLHEKVHDLGARTIAIKPAFVLVDYLNQIGSRNRIVADRSLSLAKKAGELDAFGVQTREIERDIANVRWLGEAADELGAMLDDALATIERGALRRTRDPGAQHQSPEDAGARAAPRTVRALIPLDPERSSLGLPRDPLAPVALGKTALRLTLERLARCRRLSGAIVVTNDDALAREAIGAPIDGFEVTIRTSDRPPLRERAPGLCAARLGARAVFRSAIGGVSVFDEAHDPALTAEAMDATATDAALLVGADWCLVDPELCDTIVERHLEDPATLRLVYSQAPPGLAGCVVARTLAHDLAKAALRGGPLATIGGLLSYIPSHPTPDPIANPPCVQVPGGLRSCGIRFVADPGAGAALVGAIAEALASRFASASHADVLAHARRLAPATDAPEHLTIEPTTSRGVTPPWVRERLPADGAELDAAIARRAIDQLADARPDAGLSLAGRGDPLHDPSLPELVAHARDRGLPFVHVRTSLDAPTERVRALLDAHPHAISIDLWADDAPTYLALTGSDAFDHVRANLDLIGASRVAHAGLSLPLIIPRITRCDEVYEQIEALYDRAIMAFGWGVIDPAPVGVSERLHPLPRPASARRRVWDRSMTLLADAHVALSERLSSETPSIGTLRERSLTDLWRELIDRRRDAANRNETTDPSLDVGP